MKKFYYIETPSNENGDLLVMSVSPVDSARMSIYLDALREEGEVVAGPLFPPSWKWVDMTNHALPTPLIADAPSNIGAGMVMLEGAFAAFNKSFPGAVVTSHQFSVGDEQLMWFRLPVVNEKNIRDTHSPIFLIEPSYERACSTEFKEWWEANRFTGLEFKVVV